MVILRRNISLGYLLTKDRIQLWFSCRYFSLRHTSLPENIGSGHPLQSHCTPQTKNHKKNKKNVSGRNERNNNIDDRGRRRRRRRARRQHCTLACLASQSTSGSSPTYFLFPQNEKSKTLH